jgi:2,4-dienoyl-CoA reductase-like NADH-dependent reductase (Old Yellow Enzyme family)
MYYSQRTSLFISELTFISPQAGGYEKATGIYRKEQIAAWKDITRAVHANMSFTFLQVWAMGHAAHSEVLGAEGSHMTYFQEALYLCPRVTLVREPSLKPKFSIMSPSTHSGQECLTGEFPVDIGATTKEKCNYKNIF